MLTAGCASTDPVTPASTTEETTPDIDLEVDAVAHGYCGCNIICFDELGKVVYSEGQELLPFAFCVEPPLNCLTRALFRDDCLTEEELNAPAVDEGFEL